MNYLFFDIECANCFEGQGKIYSFGYALTDAKFNIIEHKDILVNPNTKFDSYVRRNMLAYPLEKLYSQPKFPNRYSKINKLFDVNSTIAIGYSVHSDISFLLDECMRYELEPFKINYFDLRNCLSSIYKDEAKSLGIEYEKWCGKAADQAHSSDADALYTMEIAKAVCKNQKISLDNLIKSNASASGKTRKFKFGFEGEQRKDYRKVVAERNLKRAQRKKKKIAMEKKNKEKASAKPTEVAVVKLAN